MDAHFVTFSCVIIFLFVCLFEGMSHPVHIQTCKSTHKPDQTKINTKGFDMSKSAAQLLYGPVFVFCRFLEWFDCNKCLSIFVVSPGSLHSTRLARPGWRVGALQRPRHSPGPPPPNITLHIVTRWGINLNHAILGVVTRPVQLFLILHKQFRISTEDKNYIFTFRFLPGSANWTDFMRCCTMIRNSETGRHCKWQIFIKFKF